MTAPDLRPVGAAATTDQAGRPLTRVYRLRVVYRGAVARLIRPARMVPALAALGLGVAGSYVLWGLGVALLVGAGLAAWIDARL